MVLSNFILIVAVHSDHITALKCPRCKDKEVKGERLDSFLWRLVRYPQRMPAVKSSYLMLVACLIDTPMMESGRDIDTFTERQSRG